MARNLARPPLSPLLTVDEAAAALHVDPATVRRRISDHSIDAVRIGGLVRIRPEELERVRLEGAQPREAV
jgi:excisionase family DNA binding protein